MKIKKSQLSLASESPQKDGRDPFSRSRHALRPNLHSAITISSFLPLGPNTDLQAMLDELDSQTSSVWAGNLGRSEEMLSAQAHTLDAVFNTLAQKAATAMKSGHLASTEAYLRMALKAQCQARTTIEALADIKTPKSTTFVKQANIAQQQQVNNGPTVNSTASHTRAHEEKVDGYSNKLLEAQHGERMDGRTACTTISNDSNLEAMGKILRPTNRGR